MRGCCCSPNAAPGNPWCAATLQERLEAMFTMQGAGSNPSDSEPSTSTPMAPPWAEPAEPGPAQSQCHGQEGEGCSGPAKASPLGLDSPSPRASLGGPDSAVWTRLPSPSLSSTNTVGGTGNPLPCLCPATVEGLPDPPWGQKSHGYSGKTPLTHVGSPAPSSPPPWGEAPASAPAPVCGGEDKPWLHGWAATPNGSTPAAWDLCSVRSKVKM